MKLPENPENDMPGEACYPDRRFLLRILPGLRIVGAIRMAFDLRKLVIAALGLALLHLGWWLLDRIFPASAAVTPDLSAVMGPIGDDWGGESWTSAGLRHAHERLSGPFKDLFSPLMAIFDPRGNWAAMLHAILGLTWLLLIWGICGGAICRIAIVRVAQTQQTGIGQALGFSLQKAFPLILAPFIALGCLAFCGALLAGFGLLYRFPFIGGAVAGILLFIPLVFGFIMTMLAAALAAGWPLVHAAVAAGAEDALDALSRSFGYLNQRIGSFLAFACFAWLEGMIGITLMDLLAAGVLRLTEWGLGLTAPAIQIAAIFDRAGGLDSPVSSAAHSFWLGVVSLVAHAWAYSFFWTAAAHIYLWLRHEVDGTPWEVLEPPGVPASALITASTELPAAGPPVASPVESE
jgi:hypothetical protein